MSVIRKSFAIGFVTLILSATGAFAQTGGADVPTDAKKQGAKENGASSTGVKPDGTQKQSGDPEKGGSMEKK